jgi:hypothetical protein
MLSEHEQYHKLCSPLFSQISEGDPLLVGAAVMGGGAVAVVRVAGSTTAVAGFKAASSRSARLPPSCSPGLHCRVTRSSHNHSRQRIAARCHDLRSTKFSVGQDGFVSMRAEMRQRGWRGVRASATIDTSDVVKAAEGTSKF